MSAISDPVGFELDDVLTRVIPGAVFVFSISISISELGFFSDVISYSPYSTTFIAFGVILSFIFGELIELARFQIYRTPRTFTKLVYRTTRDKDHLYWSDRIRVHLFDWISDLDISEFDTSELRRRDKMFYIPWMNESIYYVEDEYSGNVIDELADSNPLPGDEYFPDYLYYHFLKQIEPSLSKGAKRRKTLSRFFMNFKISLVPTYLTVSYLVYVWLENVPLIVFILIVIFASIMLYFYGLVLVNTALKYSQISYISDLIRGYLYQKEIHDEVEQF